MKKILGWDISSTTCGWCYLELNDDKTIKYIKSGYLKPLKTGSTFFKLKDLQQKVQKIIDDIKPDIIGIEEIVKFMAGKSSATSIITLAVYNRTVGMVAYNYLGKDPNMYNVMSIRHNLKKHSKLKDLPKKEDMPEIVAKLLNIKFPYEYKKKKVDTIKTESYDEADGIAVALHCALTQK